MSSLLGLGAAVLGNVCIGAGQTIQKLALNRIAQRNLPTQTAARRRTAQAHRQQLEAVQGLERFTDRLWLTGIAMSYIGETGNWIALSLVSAALVTPLGIVSVLTNVVLAQRFLGEQLGPRQRRGYMLVLLGVLGIMLVAPKGRSRFGDTAAEVLNSCTSPGVVNAFTLLFILVTLLIYHIFVNQTHKITVYVTVCSLFGTVTIMSTKILSLLIRLSSSDAAYAEAERHGANETLAGAPANGTAMAAIGVAPDHSREVWHASLTFGSMIALSVAAQEFFKQQALGRFPVSRFQPMLYAGFNGCVVLSSVLLFGETDTPAQTALFILSFGACMAAIVRGISTVQMEDHVSTASAKST